MPSGRLSILENLQVGQRLICECELQHTSVCITTQACSPSLESLSQFMQSLPAQAL